MTIVSEIWTWQTGDRLYSRFTTNVGSERFLNRLRAVSLLEYVETVHAYFGDRADGGSGYELLWKRQVTLDELQKALPSI